MEIQKETYTITELSNILNTTDHTLRYYEKEFNLNVPRDSRGRRFYVPETANIFYQIKKMRDEGLEIKAIKKILITKNIINTDDRREDSVSIVTVQNQNKAVRTDTAEIKNFIQEVSNQIADTISAEVLSTRRQILQELNKTKLELGACVENSARKFEAKMEKHFIEIDNAISNWRNRKKKGFFKRLLDR